MPKLLEEEDRGARRGVALLIRGRRSTDIRKREKCMLHPKYIKGADWGMVSMVTSFKGVGGEVKTRRG